MINRIKLDSFIDDPAKLIENFTWIVTVATAIEKLGTTADEAVVFVGPFDEFDVSVTLAHLMDSDLARHVILLLAIRFHSGFKKEPGRIRPGSLLLYYLAYSTVRISRSTVMRISPGKVISSLTRLAMSLAM